MRRSCPSQRAVGRPLTRRQALGLGGMALEDDADALRPGVFPDVRQRLLQDAIERGLDGVGQAVVAVRAGGVHVDADAARRAELLDEGADGALQPHVVQHGRAELEGEAVVVPCMLQFVVGKREFGLGTDGLQILQAKSWWGASKLKEEIRSRQERLKLRQEDKQ